MKRILSLFFLIGSAASVQAQSFDDVMIKNRYVNCQDVTFNASGMISTLYKKNQLDSLYSFLDYWQSKCGKIESIFRLRLLLDIKSANFDPESVSTETFGYMLGYKPRPYYYHTFYDRTNFNNDYTQALKNVDDQITAIGKDIEQTYSVDESLLKEFFTSDSASFADLKKTPATESKLRKIYDQRLTETLNMPEFHWAFFLGYYHPFGKLDVFGPHPTLGMMGGFKKFRHNFDLVMDIRMGPSQNEYEFIYKGALMKDDKWTGFYFGLEYTYDFIHAKKIRVGISPGFGFNGITAVPGDDDNDEDSKTLPSYDANGGLAVKYLFGRTAYAGLQIRYHWVDHRNPGGTELNGNYLSARLIIGSIFNYDRTYRLRQLE
jgi:hypothetical protein